VVAEPDAAAAMRRELGRQLASRRRAAGYVQRELGVLLGYSRTAVANAENGGPGIGHQLWERADRVLGTGELFTRGCARIQAQLAAESRASAGRHASGAAGSRELADGTGQPADGLESLTALTALEACLKRGWPAEGDPDGQLWLVTGTAIDALEVPRQAGMLVMSWWLYTRGVPDEIRGLPALPDPASALAVVAAGSRCYFLVQSGACPWTRRDVRSGGIPGSAGTVVCWHADGGRVPAPPSRPNGGERARWAHIPSGGGQLVSPMALLHVLAQAVTSTQEGAGVILPGGVRAVPAVGTSLSAESA